MAKQANLQLCSECDFVALSGSELADHLSQSGHKKRGVLGGIYQEAFGRVDTLGRLPFCPNEMKESNRP